MLILQRLKSRISIETTAALLVIAFGLGLRLRQYTLNISFWLDEAMLALNIIQRTFGELVRPLDYDQGAPLGFLWTVKVAEIVLGNHEYSLRLFPFLAGCLSLFILWWVARQFIRPVGLVFVLAIFASSRYLVSYGVQVKQYAVDVTVTLLLYLLGLSLLRKVPEINPRATTGYHGDKSPGCVTQKSYWLAGILGGLSIWMSHAAVFTLGGLGLVLIGAAALKKDWRSARNYTLVSIFWAFNFVVLYLIQYRNLAANSYLSSFWAEYFMPLSFSAFGWTLDRLAGLFYNPGGILVEVPSVLILILFFAGLISLFLRERRWVWMFALSLVFTLAASSLNKYPFGGRMGMFAVPGLLICVGEGIELLRRLFARDLFPQTPRAGDDKPGGFVPQGKYPGLSLGLVGAILLAGFLAFGPLAFSVELALKPKMTENIAPTMSYLKTNIRPGDVIYLYRMSIPAFRYYAPKYKLENVQVFNGADFHQNRAGYQSELDQLAGGAAKRVWLLYSHLTDYEYVDDRDYMLNYANQIGEKKREFSDPGTSINLYLYDLTRR